jgi:hypothetical protein
VAFFKKKVFTDGSLRGVFVQVVYKVGQLIAPPFGGVANADAKVERDDTDTPDDESAIPLERKVVALNTNRCGIIYRPRQQIFCKSTDESFLPSDKGVHCHPVRGILLRLRI